MKGYYFKVFLFAVLFVALCIKVGQISTAEGMTAVSKLVRTDLPAAVDNSPQNQQEEDFRGISPRPDLSKRLAPAKREIKHDVHQVQGKTSMSQSVKETTKKDKKVSSLR